jgi:hypothetical protein
MKMQCFADDSQNDDFYTVAGYVALTSEWEGLYPQWHSVLKERPRLGFYRTTDALSLQGQFKGWSAESRDARMSKLASVIPTRNNCAVAAHLSKQDFKELFAPNFLRVWDDPYYLCASHLIEKTCLMLRLGQNSITKVDFIFDRQGKVGTNFSIAYNAMLRPMSLPIFPFMGDVTHENKATTLPLQAADMHAGWVRRSRTTTNLGTAADFQLSRIEQREFQVSRDFLARLAIYKREHAQEIDQYFDKVAPE